MSVCLLRCRISGGTNSAMFVEARGWGSTIGIEQAFVLFCATHFFSFGLNVYVIKASRQVYGCITAINVLAFDGSN